MTDANQATITHGAGEAMRHLPVLSIARSLTNPRKHFDPTKLQELADSIKATGVHQPILVRPLPAHRVADEQTCAKAEKRERAEYELVAGERRWRASQLAGAAQIPAMIRDMTDAQALEAQVIENLQREDVTELEEAEGYQILMEQQGINADQMGAKIGKSRAYVYGRLKVLSLCEGGRDALRAGTIDFSKALLAARIPSEKLQMEAIAYMTRLDYRDRLPGYRDCAEYVQREFMLRLDKARFTITDASLLPKAGSCSDCSKRTGANPDLFSDVDSADVCTDRPCFEQKTEAHTALQVAAAEAKGQTVIFGQDAQDLAVHGYKEQLKGYRRLDSLEDSPHDKQTLRKIIGAQMEADGILPVKVESPRRKGELIDVLPNEVVLRLLKIVDGQAKASDQVSAEVRAFSEDKKAKAEKKAKAQFEQAWRNQLRDRTWRALNGSNADMSLDVHRYLVLRTVHSLSTLDAEPLAELLGLGRVGAHSALIQFAEETPRPDHLHMLCVMQKDVSASGHSYYNRESNEGLMLVAGAMYGNHIGAVIEEEKHTAAAKHLAKLSTDSTDAPKGDIPLTSAARAGEGGGDGKAKKSKRPAARAAEGAGKLDAAAATASIAAALQALPGDAVPGAAAAAQGNEAGPVAAGAAQAPAPLVTLKRSKLATPPADTPASEVQAQSANDGQAGADAKTGAAATKAMTPETRSVGLSVRVLATVDKKLRAMIGDEGRVTALMGDRAVMVEFPAAPRCKPISKSFDASELEIIE
ncbi:MAG: ParB/RepB/Spo0J family partition protein [Comamonas sp.]|jgi:ParB/RepB/Spo0J family partition protein|uniref:ParB/RepB/Spo0J family partition protein n=1 Tax=Comamonas sp. TaxID=34028 RepID=UPI00281F57CB|nr:ParB/RepB/Spo0J family partition protein [Comamonas sp.]MDR0214562.1 ParB/RepB/Spo0J family partition protein [Comamonas sp.]